MSEEPVIVVTRRWPDAVQDELRRRHPRVRFNPADRPLGPDGLRAALREADAVLPTVSDRLPAELFDGGVRARFLGNFGVGHEHIDLDAARGHGVVVTNTPGVLTESTADLTLTLMLMAARRAGTGERELRAGRWTGWGPTDLLGADVTGRTLGVIGMGRIGRAVARRAHHGFGMPVVYAARRGSADADAAIAADVPGATRLGGVDEVLEAADFVSLHVPGNGNTHLIDAARLARMKPTAFLINTARGNVVDQDALTAALQARAIAGAGLDVYTDEPRVPEALRELDNVVLLPHMGSATLETRTAMGMLVLDNLEAFLNGQEPPNRVA